MSGSAATLGQQLQAARSKKGLTAPQAADALHLDPWVIEGLESGSYERLGPAVYVKGHLKQYAVLLGLPPAEVLAAYESAPAATPVPAQAGGLRPSTSSMPAGSDLAAPSVLGFAVVALIVAGVMWQATAAAPESTNSRQLPEPPGAAMASSPGVAFGTAVLPVVAAPAAVLPAANSKGASGRARLRLSFLGDSWVDVHDAAGQRLFAGTGHINTVRSISGEAPFRIYLKAASSIRMEINNHVVAIEPQYVIDDAARFEAGADGVLRRDLHAAPGTAPGPGPRG